MAARILLAFFMLLFALQGAAAERRFALVIGNGDYAATGDLPNAVNDARLMADTLRAVGFETELVENVSEDAFGAALDRLAEKAASFDVVAFYYAGHGIQKDSQNFLIPVDAQMASFSAVERETVSLQSVMDAMELAPISLLFLDACRDNPFAAALAGQAKAQGRSVSIARGLAVVRPAGDMLIAFATLPDAVAFDGDEGNSPFARALAKHATTPDVEVSVVMKRVTSDVLGETKGEQRPQQLSQMQREFYFVRSAAGPVVRAEIPAVLTVYPAQVSNGDEVAIVADVPEGCKPAFLDVPGNAKITPVPIEYFKVEELGSGMTRYEISPRSRYGLKVLESDERGVHSLGYFCEPEGLGKGDKVGLLRELITRLDGASLSGTLDFGGKKVLYSFQQYSVR